MNLFHNKKGTKGFTLIEVVIVVSIISLISSFIFVAFINYSEQQLFRARVIEATSVIKEARQKTLSSETATQFGVYVGANEIVVFEGLVYDPMNATNITTQLPGVLLTPQLSAGASEFIFTRLTGEVSATGTILITNYKFNSTSTILIHQSGLVE